MEYFNTSRIERLSPRRLRRSRGRGWSRGHGRGRSRRSVASHLLSPFYIAGGRQGSSGDGQIILFFLNPHSLSLCYALSFSLSRFGRKYIYDIECFSRIPPFFRHKDDDSFTSHAYCMYEIPDHKVGIYCNVIGPLAALRHCEFSCKKVPRYFCQNRRTSYSGTIR